jgi:type II secretory pathway pseudopilin PulG
VPSLFLAVLALIARPSGLLAAPSSQSIVKSPANAPAAELFLREIHYDGKLTEDRAVFTVEIDAESIGKNEASVALFEGDVAVMPAKLPAGLRIFRNGKQYRLIAARPGPYKFKVELIARITRAEPWDQVTFVGPAAGIASVTAQAAGDGVEVQLLSGTPLEPEPGKPGRVRGVLGPDRNLALRWQGRTTEAARKAMTACDTTATALLTPTVIKVTTEFRYQIVQGNLARLVVALPSNHALTRVEGEQIRDWQITRAQAALPTASAAAASHPSPTTDGPAPDAQILTIELIKPVEKSYALKIFSEQTVETTPFAGPLTLPQPQGVDRETGSLNLVAEDTVVETGPLAGLRQINAPAGSLAAYRFYGRPLSLGVALRRIDPLIHVAARVSARLEEARLLVFHSLSLTVEKAGIYSLELSPLPNLVVTDVRGEGVEDWKSTDGKLLISFATRVLGERGLDIQLEQAQKNFPQQIVVSPLRVSGAAAQTAQIGAASAPGISLKTSELSGLREIPAGNLANRTDELLAYLTDQADWTLKLSTEKPAPRVVADIFNLVTIGDGLVGGSATVRYVIVNQGVQEFRLRLPAAWKNIDFTGPNIRRKEVSGALPGAAGADTNFVVWTIGLQDKAWGGYTLVVTYDQQFDPHQAMLSLGGIHAMDVERETGSVAVTSAASLQLREAKAGEPLQRIDEGELAPTDRALIARSVLLAYRYGGGETYDLSVEATRFPEEKVLDAVADRTQLTTVVTEAGEVLTQASFMVKNNDKQFQKFTLPKGARFWSAYVNGQPAKAEADGDALLMPLPRRANRDQAFAVEIVYAQKVDSLNSLSPRAIALVAPQTDVQTTFAEWELYVPATHQLTSFGGNMSVARGTTYGWRDAWTEFATAYREFWRSAKNWLAVLVFGVAIATLVIAAVRRGWHGALTALVVIGIGAVLAGMLLPSLAKAKSKAQRIAATNNLKQIGLAARIYSNDNSNRLPSSFDQMRNEIGTDKLLVDPASGQRFVWVGAGKTDNDPAAIIAFSPVDMDGRAALFADGSVAQLTTRQFEEALQRGGLSPAQFAALNAPGPAAIPTTSPAAAAMPAGPGGAVSMAALQPNAPMSAGLRALRIDLPRSGQRFTFTKVLKLGGEPLTVRAMAVTTKVLHAVRSACQVGVFIAGLLLLWWQLRRAAPRSLAVTLAVTMIIGSTSHLLLTTRLLGTAMVVTLPMLVVTLVVLLARRYRPHRAESPDAQAAGSSPTTSPGMGPAIAGIALILSLASAQAGESAPQPATGHPPSAANTVSILSATYTGTVHERVARVEAVIQVAAPATAQTFPLFGEDVAVEEFSATPATARLVRQGDSVGVRLPGGREAVLRVRFLVKLAGDVTRRHLAFTIPPALSSRLSLTVDEADAAVEFPTAVAYHSILTAQQTRVEAVIGAGERVELQWTPRVKRAADIAATVFCQNASLAVFTGGALTLRSQLDYQITQGELREVRLRLPAGHRLLRVEGEFIRTWQVKEGAPSRLPHPPDAVSGQAPPLTAEATGTTLLPPSAGPDPSRAVTAAAAGIDDDQILVAELTRGVSPGYRLMIETERSIDRLPDRFVLDTPHALDVKRETGFVALAGSDELGMVIDQARGLQKVDAAEFLKVMRQEKTPAGAYQYLRPDFTLSVRVAPLQPQIEAIVHNRVRIGVEQIHLDASVDYTIRRAGVFALRLVLPADFRVETVAATVASQQVQTPDPRPQPQGIQWIEKKEDNRRILEVALPQRTLGRYGLDVRLVRSQKELAPRVEAPGVHPLDTVKLTGYVVVLGEVGVQVKTASLEGLTEVPVTAAGSGAGVPPANASATGLTAAHEGDAGGGLAYKFLASDPVPTSTPWKLAVTTETIESWVRAEVVNWLTLTETLATGRALVRFEVQNAPVKELRLRIPAVFKNVEINGPNIRRRDRNGDEWRIELQNKVIGQHILTVTWEQPWSVKEQGAETPLDVAGVEAPGVERETGMLAVMARSPLQITTRSAGAELIRAEAQELPDWAGHADESTVLVYRYLRPGYKLVLAARRFVQAETLQALVDEARLTTVVADDGQMMTELALSVRNNGRQFLEIALPPGAQVWSAFVAGQAVRPGSRAGKLLLPLERAADLAIAVELIYVSADPFPRNKGPVDLASPALDIPVKNTRWELYLPPDYAYSNFGGTMTREPDAAPVVRTFSALDYREAEQEKKKEREIALSSSRDEFRRQLSGGKLGEASKAYNMLQRYRTEAESDEFKALDKDLRKAQSGNLVLAQQEVIDNNAGLLHQARNAKEPGTQLDAGTAELQWDKLQRAQEVRTAAARPLRVNLPARGLRHSFSQVLQTETGKPMRIRFTASSEKTVSWPSRIGLLTAGFVSLWAMVGWILGARKVQRPGSRSVEP